MSNKPNAILVDSDVMIHDPSSLDILRDNGANVVFVPRTAILELDTLRSKPDVGLDATTALQRIEELRSMQDKSLQIFDALDFGDDRVLNPRNPDHQMIASAIAWAPNLNGDFASKKLVSRNAMVRMIVENHNLGVVVEDYHRNRLDEELADKPLRIVDVSARDIDTNNSSDFTFAYDEAGHSETYINEGVVCQTDFNAIGVEGGTEVKPRFVAYRKGDRFHIVRPNIEVFGISPTSINGNGQNWQQHLALGQLMDPSIELVFLRGGAGTGKTLLAVAAAFEQKRGYPKLVISRPAVHLGDEDNYGYLKGDLIEKMSPWRRPIDHVLDFLKQDHSSRDDEEHFNLRRKKIIENSADPNKPTAKFSMQALDHIRGMTFHRTFMIIDEAQNLTPHQVKTIITRAGNGIKMVFTGDLDQIDRSRTLDKRSSGLAYAIKRMIGHKRVGVITFTETVRSPLASMAEERL